MQQKTRFKVIIFLAFVMCFMITQSNFAAPPDIHNSLASNVRIDTYNVEPIYFTSNDIKSLPSEAQKFIKGNINNIVASTATIHIVKKSKGKEPQIITSKKYDFSKVEEIKKFKDDRMTLDKNFTEGLSNFNIRPLSEDEHGGYIITGINVSYITGTEYKNYFQLQGYWDWQTQFLVSRYDKLGLGWTNGFSSDEITHNAYGNRHYDGASITLNKLPYETKERFNKGVIWTHASDYSSEGAALAQIYDNSLSNQDIGVWFEYVAPQGPSEDDGWWVDIENLLFSYFGLPMPGAYYFDSFETAHCL